MGSRHDAPASRPQNRYAPDAHSLRTDRIRHRPRTRLPTRRAVIDCVEKTLDVGTGITLPWRLTGAAVGGSPPAQTRLVVMVVWWTLPTLVERAWRVWARTGGRSPHRWDRKLRRPRALEP